MPSNNMEGIFYAKNMPKPYILYVGEGTKKLRQIMTTLCQIGAMPAICIVEGYFFQISMLQLCYFFTN